MIVSEQGQCFYTGGKDRRPSFAGRGLAGLVLDGMAWQLMWRMAGPSGLSHRNPGGCHVGMGRANQELPLAIVEKRVDEIGLVLSSRDSC